MIGRSSYFFLAARRVLVFTRFEPVALLSAVLFSRLTVALTFDVLAGVDSCATAD